MSKYETYVERYFQSAQKAGDLFKMDPLIILAQGSLESGWGTSNLSVNYNNFFGITTGSAKSNQFWSGGVYVGKNKYKLRFRVYSSAENGFKDFARLIASSYKTAYSASRTDYKKYAHAIANSPYISEKNGDNRKNYENIIIRNYGIIAEIVKKKDFLKPQELA